MYERRLIGMENDRSRPSPGAFVEFTKSNNPVLVGKRIIAFLSSERTRADLGDISTDTINNWSKP
jgi:hypothetical protein